MYMHRTVAEQSKALAHFNKYSKVCMSAENRTDKYSIRYRETGVL